jgi:phosphatidylglycerol:prolipoprotein diacylglycerol transferase
MTYKKFKKHGLIDTLFIVAFLFGILGARLWYCIVLEPEVYFGGDAPPLYFLYGIVDGGLAVQGGALLGIIAGVTFMLLFRKYIDVRFMMDVAIPTILLAQAIGRIGNFFNQEVYGAVTTYDNLWYLPTIIRKNMEIGGQFRVPLFFIEAVMNIGGYFLIRYLLGKVAKFHIGLGYQASSYLVWYGIVRVVLEPLREGYTASTATEGFGYLQSYITAFVFIGIGLAMIAGFYIYHRIRMNKGIEDKFGDKVERV